MVLVLIKIFEKIFRILNLKLKYLNGLIFADVIVEKNTIYLILFNVVWCCWSCSPSCWDCCQLAVLVLSSLVCGCLHVGLRWWLMMWSWCLLFLGFLFCSLFIIVDVLLFRFICWCSVVVAIAELVVVLGGGWWYWKGWQWYWVVGIVWL